MKQCPDFVLASRSPRRSELLLRAGYRFRVVPPPLPEPHTAAGSPTEVAEALAYFKARAVHETLPNEVVLGADTVVALGGRILGKAATPEEARSMLADISGTRHAVVTGLALLLPAAGHAREEPYDRYLAAETTHVTMRPVSADEIDQYVASGEWRDKAGAYAIQETADRFVARVEGSFTNVVGLPMELLERLWRSLMKNDDQVP